MCTVNVINLHKGWKGGWVEWKFNYLCAECHFSAEICGVSLSGSDEAPEQISHSVTDARLALSRCNIMIFFTSAYTIGYSEL